MFAVKCPALRVPSFTFKKKTIQRRVRCYYSLDKTNSQPIDDVVHDGLFHVLAFIKDGDTGIYSIRQLDDEAIVQNHIIAFTNFEDAFRYKTLLEAEMDHRPYVQFASRFELEHMCHTGGYRCRIVNEGALVTPPTRTMKITDWERRSALLEGRWSVREKDEGGFENEWP
jgi:hypothetical protein